MQDHEVFFDNHLIFFLQELSQDGIQPQTLYELNNMGQRQYNVLQQDLV